MIFRILFICILFSFIAPVSANQVDFRNDETLEESFLPPGAVFDPSWMMCKQAKDCTAIEGPCETFLPINKKSNGNPSTSSNLDLLISQSYFFLLSN